MFIYTNKVWGQRCGVQPLRVKHAQPPNVLHLLSGFNIPLESIGSGYTRCHLNHCTNLPVLTKYAF
jgi:hypothetical protein